jgi:HK97 family phage major capsid protein
MTEITNEEFKEVKSISQTSSVENNGFLPSSNLEIKTQVISPESLNTMESNIASLSVVQNLVQNHVIDSDSLELVQEDLSSAASWGQVSNSSNAVRKVIKTSELIVQPKATQKFTSDLGQMADSIMFNKICESFARAQNKAYLVGDGVNAPRGMLTYPSADVTRIEVSAITTLSIQNLITSLNDSYLEGACFLVNSTTGQLLRSLSDSNSRAIYQNCFSGGISTIFGFPVYVTNDMPNASDVKIVFANFKKAYVSVQNTNVKFTSDCLTEKPFIKYYAVKRVGGDLINKDAIKFLAIK